jgi:hypothetical protein
LNNKQAEVRERRRRVKEVLDEAIKSGQFFLNGDKADIKGSSVKEKINTAFKLLVDNVYTKLGYVKEFLDSERELIPILSPSDDQLSFDDPIKTNPNELAKREVHDFISLQDDIKKQVRVKTLYDRFSDKPYGWKTVDIAGQVAQLLKEQRIRIRYNAEYLEPEENVNTLLNIFTKTAEADKAIVLKRVKVDEQLIKTAKSICKDVFNKMDLADDEDGLVKDIRILIDKQIDEINSYKARYEGRKYPGMSLLDKGLEYFEPFNKGLDNSSFFMKLKELEDDLLDWEEDIVYVKSFFASQKDIFDNGLAGLKKMEENKAYIENEQTKVVIGKLRTILQDPIPYKKIKDIPELLYMIDQQIVAVLDEKRANAKEKLKLDYDHVALLAKQYGVSNDTKQQVDRYYEELNANVDRFQDIFKVDATISQSTSFKEKMVKKMNDEMLLKPPIGPVTIIDLPVKPAIQKEEVKVSKLVSVKTLTSEEDVDQYIRTLSNELKKIIQSNKHIEFIE